MRSISGVEALAGTFARASQKLLWTVTRPAGWFLFAPSRWRAYIHTLDPTLSPNFSLAELRWAHWRRRQLWSLLLVGFVLWPLLSTLAVALVYLGRGDLSQSIGVGLVLGWGMSLMLALLVGTAVGMAAGLVTVTVAALLLGSDQAKLADIIFHPALGLFYGLTTGMILYISTSVAREPTQLSLWRQIGAVIAGLAGSLFVLLLFTGLSGGAAYLYQGGIIGAMTCGLALIVQPALAVAIIIGWRVQSWRKGVAVGLLIILILVPIMVFLLGRIHIGTDMSGILLFTTVLSTISVMYLVFFTIPYTLGERFSDPGVGAAIGFLATLVVYLAMSQVFPYFYFAENMGAGLLCALLLGAMAWWRPVLFYPFAQTWNIILYRLDTRPFPARRLWLHWHTAFWDEQQKLPLYGLENHLLWALTEKPAEGAAAVERLYQGTQRWAVQSARLEIIARQMEQADKVQAIGQMGSVIGLSEEGEGSISPFLRQFAHISQNVSAARQQITTYNQRLALTAVIERLDYLLQDLLLSTDPYATRLESVAAGWRAIILAHTEGLKATAERKQEIPNPYVIAIPLTQEQEIFVGRTAISKQLETLLLDERQPPLLLYGQRRMGKTSLLNNLGRLLPTTILPLFVDLQGPASYASNHAHLLYNLSRSMVASARRLRALSLPERSKQEFEADPFTVFDEWLDEVETMLQKNRMVSALLALDEFEALDAALSAGRYEETAVLGMLRHIIQHRDRFKILLSGSHTLDEFRRWSGYLINAQVLHIGPLQEEEAVQLITRPIKNFGLEYEATAVWHILELTAGHPFLVQLLCGEIVSLKNDQALHLRRLVTVDDVATAVPPALERGSLFFVDLERNQLNEPARQIAGWLAESKRPLSRKYLETKMPEPLVESALAILRRREVLVHKDGAGFDFQNELLRRWFKSDATGGSQR